MELNVSIFNSFQIVTIAEKSSILDVTLKAF